MDIENTDLEQNQQIYHKNTNAKITFYPNFNQWQPYFTKKLEDYQEKLGNYQDMDSDSDRTSCDDIWATDEHTKRIKRPRTRGRPMQIPPTTIEEDIENRKMQKLEKLLHAQISDETLDKSVQNPNLLNEIESSTNKKGTKNQRQDLNASSTSRNDDFGDFQKPRKTTKAPRNNEIRLLETDNRFNELSDMEIEPHNDRSPQTIKKKTKFLPLIVLDGTPKNLKTVVGKIKSFTNKAFYVKVAKKSTLIYFEEKEDLET